MIYELCLVYSWELVPFPASYESAKRKPWNSLLFVDKTIFSEAAKVFYRKNTWRLSDSAGRVACRSNGWKGPPLLWKTHLRYMRHLTIALDGRAVSRSTMWELGADLFTKGAYSQTEERRHQDMHGELDTRLEKAWVQKLRMLRKIRVELKSLRVDLSNAYCPLAHCRPIRLIIRLLNKYVPYPDDLLSFYVTVTGMETEEEALYAHECGYLCEDCNDGIDEEDGSKNSYCTRSLPFSGVEDDDGYWQGRW